MMKLATACAGLVLVGSAPVMAQSLQSIGVAPGASFSACNAISADGLAVVARSGSSFAFRWTAAVGLESLGAPSDYDGHAISADGSTIVGNWGGWFGGDYPFRWTSSHGFEDFEPFSEVETAWGVSADDSVIVGSVFGPGAGLEEAYRWTNTGGVEHLGFLAGMPFSRALGISADGSIVVGFAAQSGDGLTNRAFRWTREEGMQELPPPSGSTWTMARAISADKSTVVGSCHNPGPREQMTRWTDLGVEVLGAPFGYDSAAAIAVSADGSVLVGAADCCGPDPDSLGAAIWTPALGLRDLGVYLAELGVDMGGWELNNATGVSADGRVIVGWGHLNGEWRGWIATIPRCGSADFNCDGNVGTDADIESFFACLAGNCPAPRCRNSADFNGDGDTGTDADIEAFFRALAGGTC